MDKRLLGIMIIGFLLMGFIVFTQKEDNQEKDAVAEATRVFNRLRDSADQGRRGFDHYDQADPRKRDRADLTRLSEQMKYALNDLRTSNDEYFANFNKSHPAYEPLNIRMNGTLDLIHQALRLEDPADPAMMKFRGPLLPGAYQKPDRVPTSVVNNYISHDNRGQILGGQSFSESYTGGPNTQIHAPVDSRSSVGAVTSTSLTEGSRAQTWSQGAQTFTEGSRAKTLVQGSKTMNHRGGDVLNLKEVSEGDKTILTVNEGNSFLSFNNQTDVDMTVPNATQNFAQLTPPPAPNKFDPPKPTVPNGNAALLLDNAKQAHVNQIPLGGAAKFQTRGTNDLLAEKPKIPVKPPQMPDASPPVAKPKPQPALIQATGFGSLDKPLPKVSDPVEDVHGGDEASGNSLIPFELENKVKRPRETTQSISIDTTELRPVKKPKNIVAVRTNTQIEYPKMIDSINVDTNTTAPAQPPPITKRSRVEPSMNSAPSGTQQRRRGKRPKTGGPMRLVPYEDELKRKQELVVVIGERLTSSKTPSPAMKEEFKKRYYDLATSVPPTIEVLPADKDKPKIVLAPKTNKFFVKVTDKVSGKLDAPVILGKDTVETIEDLLKHYGTTYDEVMSSSPDYDIWRQKLMEVNDLKNKVDALN